jgi:hypothetical protein
MKRLFQVAVLVCCTTTACDDPLLEVQTITGLRVIGARVRGEDDPSDASLRAGNATNLDWLVASDRATTYSAAVRVCRTNATTTGLPSCSEAPWFEDSGRFDAGEAATFALTPPDLPAGSPWLALFVACAESRARFSKDGSSQCSGGELPHEASFEGIAAEANENPSLADDELELAGEVWNETDPLPTGDPCRSEALPKAKQGKKSEVTFRLQGDDRQKLPKSVTSHYGALPTESLAYTHLLTVPGLERPFSAIASGAKDTEFEIAIELDGDLPRDGKVVDFYLVVRDGRGGADWLRRQLCALP